jgi:hypothetical protein
MRTSTRGANKMTNSKQYCNYCGERWSKSHDDCIQKPQRPPSTYFRLYEDTELVSTVRVQADKTLMEVRPLTFRIFPTKKEWKEEYPNASEIVLH